MSSSVSQQRLLILSAVALAVSANVAAAGRAAAADLRQTKAAEAQHSDGAYLSSIEGQNRLLADALRSEVERELQKARANWATNPATVELDLKLIAARVARTPELSADARAKLLAQLDAAISQSHRLSAAKAIDSEQTSQAKAATAEQSRSADASLRDQQRIKQLADRYQALVDQGRYVEARELAATVLGPLAPRSPIAIAAPLVAEQSGSHAVSLARRQALRTAYLDTMAPVEKAANPTPDDQPIIYQDAEAWRKLTDWRRAHSPVDMHKITPAEAKIREALKETTNIDFSEAPLEDVVDYLKDLHGIEIQIDTRSLADANMESKIPVSRRVKGISLRSALHLILNDLNLTYLITDEMLLITTPDRASRTIEARVYPVGDLFMPEDLKHLQSRRRFGR